MIITTIIITITKHHNLLLQSSLLINPYQFTIFTFFHLITKTPFHDKSHTIDTHLIHLPDWRASVCQRWVVVSVLISPTCQRLIPHDSVKRVVPWYSVALWSRGIGFSWYLIRWHYGIVGSFSLGTWSGGNMVSWYRFPLVLDPVALWYRGIGFSWYLIRRHYGLGGSLSLGTWFGGTMAVVSLSFGTCVCVCE